MVSSQTVYIISRHVVFGSEYDLVHGRECEFCKTEVSRYHYNQKNWNLPERREQRVIFAMLKLCFEYGTSDLKSW